MIGRSAFDYLCKVDRQNSCFLIGEDHICINLRNIFPGKITDLLVFGINNYLSEKSTFNEVIRSIYSDEMVYKYKVKDTVFFANSIVIFDENLTPLLIKYKKHVGDSDESTLIFNSRILYDKSPLSKYLFGFLKKLSDGSIRQDHIPTNMISDHNLKLCVEQGKQSKICNYYTCFLREKDVDNFINFVQNGEFPKRLV